MSPTDPVARGAERRLFFALWPDAATRSAIVERAQALDGLSRRRVPAHNLHLTLVFLGDVPADRVADLEAGAERVAGASSVRAFRLTLDRFGTFPPARVAWLGGAPVAEGRTLVGSLRAMVADCGIETDPRPWQPHVTLYRQVARAPEVPPPAPLVWSAASFELVESIPSQPYQVLRSWPLEWGLEGAGTDRSG